jgi:hypothetical protein
MERIKPSRASNEEFEPVWEEQYPSDEGKVRNPADIVRYDILWDALKQL